MEYIYSSLQSKYISPFSMKKSNKIALRKKVISLTNHDYPQIAKFNLRKTEDKNENHPFTEYYKNFFKKDNNTLPKLLTINEIVDLLQHRNITFADPRYPQYLINNTSKIEKRKNSFDIIESLDDPNIMQYFYDNNYEGLYNEEISNCNNQFLIDMLMPKISSIDNTQTYMKLHQYSISSADITLKLKGICIVIKEHINQKKNNQQVKAKSIKLHLPLSIIPFYYSISHQLFLYFIAKIIKMPQNIQEDFDISMISFDIDLLKKNLSDIVSDDKLFSQDCILINNESYNESQKIIDYTWLIQNKELQLKIKPLMFELKATLTPFTPYTTIANKKTDVKQKVIISKAISKTLMCSLIKRGYCNWENYALCYLSSFKLFRKYISYAYGRPLKEKVVKVFIDEHNVIYTPYSTKLLKVKAIKNQQQNYNQKKDLANDQFPNNKSAFGFFMTLNNINYFFSFYSYKVELQIDSFKTKNFNFDITFDKMKLLYQLKSKHSIEDIIRKCIIIDRSNETVSCAIELLKGISFESMEKFFESKDELNLVKSVLNVSLPRIEWNEIVNIYNSHVKEIKGQKYFLKDEIVERLLNVNKNKWPDIFSQFQDQLGKEIEKKVKRAYHKIKTMRVISPSKVANKKEMPSVWNQKKEVNMKTKLFNNQNQNYNQNY